MCKKADNCTLEQCFNPVFINAQRMRNRACSSVLRKIVVISTVLFLCSLNGNYVKHVLIKKSISISIVFDCEFIYLQTNFDSNGSQLSKL